MTYFNNIETTGNFDMGGGDFEPIPNGTKCKAMIESAEWSEYEGERYINIRWSVVGGEYNERKIFQKIRAADDEEKKRVKALTMLAAIDANAGGKIAASGKEPDDFMLMSALTNKMMFIELATWKMNGKEGNWVKAVSSSKVEKETESQEEAKDSYDGDIPF
jgi:hypothetical protein